MFASEPRLFEPARPEISPGDFGFLPFAVTLDPNDFHPIEQWLADRVQRVGRRDKEYLREIEGQIEIVIAECMVLCRIQYLKQRRCRITAKVTPHLIDLVQHQDGVVHAGPTHGLNDSSWQGADVGSAMPAQFRLIMYAAQAEPLESPSHRPGNRLPQAGLAYARRSEDRKSTRLNSSHVAISYAVFCLKKKKFPTAAGQDEEGARPDAGGA